jgi:hypothetical protein
VARSIRQEEPLLAGSGMLAAVAYSAERLLLAPDWRDAIDDVLMHLGVAAGVSRAYLIEVEPPETGYRATQVAEWCAPGVSSQFENPTLRGTPLGVLPLDRSDVDTGDGPRDRSVVPRR